MKAAMINDKQTGQILVDVTFPEPGNDYNL